MGHVDELGSGILNVNKYLPHYTPGQAPVFDEGDNFRMTIPLEVSPAGGVNEGINNVIGGVNEGTKERWEAILRLISKQGGLKASKIAKETGFPREQLKEI